MGSQKSFLDVIEDILDQHQEVEYLDSPTHMLNALELPQAPQQVDQGHAPRSSIYWQGARWHPSRACPCA